MSKSNGPGGRITTADGETYRDVGPWCKIKNQIISDYAAPYVTVIRDQPWCRGVWYVDAFAGDPVNLNRELYPIAQELIEGSAARALKVQPPFSHFHFIDQDPETVRRLHELVSGRTDVTVHAGDANDVIRNAIVPMIPYQSFRRALVILDPYGMNLDWETIKALGAARTAEVFINFPIMGINRNALRRNDSTVSDRSASSMDRIWGDPNWRETFFGMGSVDLWGNTVGWKTVTNDQVADAYCKRLRTEAGFRYVAKPLPVTNSINRTIYYLIFASQNETGYKIMSAVMNKQRRLLNR